MGRNFDAPREETEITGASPNQALDSSRARGGSRLAALALAVAASAAVTAMPTEAWAQTGPSFEFKELDVTLKGTVLNGVAIVSVKTGGWFNSTKGTLKIPLVKIVPADVLAQFEGHEIEVDIQGKRENGIFDVEIQAAVSGLKFTMPFSLDELMALWNNRSGSSCVRPDCAPRPRSCDRPADCRESVRRSIAKPLSPEPGESESGLIRLKKPFDPGTFYVDRPETGKNMGEGHPRGFDVEKDESITFFVTGEASGNTRVSIELYPWVPTDAKKRAEVTSVKVKVTIDGEEYELIPQPLPKGKILPVTKTEDKALLDTPLRLASIPIPPGTHEITVSSLDSHFRAVLRNAAETTKPNVDATIERPFIEDPDFPPEFDMNARLITAAEEPSGYKLESITKSPVKLDKIHIERIRNSTLIRVRLIMDDVTYVSEEPLMPQTDHRIKFMRETPPARSTDSEGPDELPLHVTITGAVDPSTPLPTGMTCQTRRANLYCSEASEGESRVRAFRTRLDMRPTNPAGNPRRHILRKY